MIDQLIPVSPLKRVVIIGGGFGGINLVRKLHKKGFQIVLIDKNNYHTFLPLLYQVATGGLEADSIAYPLRKIFKGYKDFYFRMARITSVNVAAKVVETNNGAISYDYLVIAAGSTSNFFGMGSLAKNAMPLKSLLEALDLRSLILQNLENSLSSNAPSALFLNLVVAGGGPTGVETSGALSELKKHVLPCDYPELNFNQARIILIEAGPRLLAGMSESASANALSSLNKMGVEVMLNTAVKDYDGKRVLLSDGSEIPTYSFIWSAGVQGETIGGIDSKSITRGNRITVDRLNRVIDTKDVFAIGDIASMKEDAYPNDHPMVAQVAIQQAACLAKNLIAMQKSETLHPFTYKDLGSLATVGRNKAVADFSFIKLKGFIAWLLWLVVHLMTLVGFRNRIVVLVNWFIGYVSYDRAIRLIVRPFKKSDLKND